MKKNTFVIAMILALAAVTFGQKTDDKSAVLAVVDQLFAEMAAANPAGIIALHTKDSQLAAIRKTKDGKVRLDALNTDQFSKFFTDKTAVIQEYMIDPKVVIDGDWAMVWGRYVFFVSNKLSHCGIDQFNLVRTTDGWKLANGASTIDPGACTDKEKKMKPKASSKN